MSGSNWSDFKSFEPGIKLTPELLRELIDGGQTFRWNFDETQASWIGQWSHYVVSLKLSQDNDLQWSAPLPLENDAEQAIHDYLAHRLDWEAIYETLPWRSDPFLKERMQTFSRLRILRQPLEETLFTFLCSSTKQIVQIKQMCELIAEHLGDQLLEGYFALPTWKQIHEASEEELRNCKLGYRAKYIKGTAQCLNEEPDFFEKIQAMTYAEAKAKLVTLPGVGEKIADCVLLFGAGKLEAFPVDTWILKSMSRHYGLEGWKPEQVAHFGRIHFGAYAGFAQQLLFAGERSEK